MGIEMFNGRPYGGVDPRAIKWSEAEKSVKKNLLKNTATSETVTGLTFTVNADGSVTANGTSTASWSFVINRITIPKGSYILSDGDVGNSNIFIQVTNSAETSAIADTINGESVMTFNSDTDIVVRFFWQNGITVSNLAFKPMIRLASIADDTYAPYIPDNTELMRCTDNAILGAKNLLQLTCPSVNTINGVTFTRNSDETITVNGTATGNIYYEIAKIANGTPVGGIWYPKSQIQSIIGKTLSGCFGGSAFDPETYFMYIDFSDDGSTWGGSIRVANGEDTVIPEKNYYTSGFRFLAFEGQSFNNMLLKPMLRLATDTDNTYVPYAKTNKELTSSIKATTLTVDTTNWTQDTTSQSGSTLYKKQISLNHVYVDSPSVDIGASGSVLPTTAEQEAYNLIKYVTVDDTVPCLYLYASDIPTTAFYINVTGVD